MTTPRRSHPIVTIVTNPQSAQPLSLRLVATNPFRRGEPATIQVIAEGGTGGYVYALGKLSLPPGMGALDPVTGISTGTPTTTGHYEFEIEVQDSSATVWAERFTVDVVSRLTPGAVTPVMGEVAVPYSYQLTVRGATGAVTWKRISGTLPAGVTLPDNGPGLLSGTPVAPFGRSYATVRATDAGTGDTLDIPIVVEIVEGLHEVFPGPGLDGNTYSVFAGLQSSVDLSLLFAGGVPPYRVEWRPPYYTALQGMTVNPPGTRNGSYVFAGIPQLGALDRKLRCIVEFRVTDALGKVITPETEIFVIPTQQNFGAQLNGSAVQRSEPTVNFTGSAVTSVTATDSLTTVQIDQPSSAGLSVLGRSTSASGAPESIQATVNDRVLARVGGALQWTQVTAAMHANSGVAAGTYDRLTVNVSGHVTAGGYAYSTIFTKNVTAAVQFFASDFSGMTTLTDVVRFTGTAAVTCLIREFFASPRSGQTVMFVNASAATYTLTNQYVGGTNAAHWDIGADFNIAPGHNALCWYDGGSQRWRIIGSY